VTDRQTDGQNYDSPDRASIAASRGKNGLTDRFAVWAVDSSVPKDAQIQSYSPGGANVPSWEDTLPSPVE